MKKLFSVLIMVFLFTFLSLSQNVDNIKVEQAGDFIKISYRIINSGPGQIYRVKVLCSINGGLNTEIRSISGDAGDRVEGGKPEYWVLWDVLKDVESLKSAEFIVRAELVSDMSSQSSSVRGVNTSGWDKKWVNVMIAGHAPGPKGGLRLGIMGSFGISGQLTYGKTVLDEKDTRVETVFTGINSSPGDYTPTDQMSLSFDLTKRIVNRNGFQMHLMAGFQRTRIAFYDYNATIKPYQEQKVFGPEIGLVFGVKRLAFSLMAIHFDPGQVEKGTNFSAVSPLNYLSACFGIRF